MDISESLFQSIRLRIRNPFNGFPVKDRKYRLKTYPKCFIGGEAVDWFVNNLGLSRQDSVSLGRLLQERGVFDHVCKDHLFKDEYLFYHFTEKKRIVIVGGGFGGSKVAKAMEKDYDVILIDKKDYFQCTPSLPTLVGDPAYISRITTKHTNYLSNAKVIVGEVSDVKPDANVVLLTNGDVIPYDYLILASGSRYQMPTLVAKQKKSSSSSSSSSTTSPDASNNPLLAKTTTATATTSPPPPPLPTSLTRTGSSRSLTSAGEIPNNNNNNNSAGSRSGSPRLASSSAKKKKKKDVFFVDATSTQAMIKAYAVTLAAKNITVIGGGPVGIEISAELATHFPDKRITIVSAREVLLERCCPDAHKNVYAFFSSCPNVTMILGEKVIGLEEETIEEQETVTVAEVDHQQSPPPSKRRGKRRTLITSSGRSIECDLCFCCMGFVPNTDFLRNVGRSEMNSNLYRYSSSSSSNMMTAGTASLFASSNNSLLLDLAGFVKVNAFLQAGPYQNIFAIGDIVNIQEEKLAQCAEKHADVVIENINKIERGLFTECVEYSPATRILIVTLGKSAILIYGDKVLMENRLVSKAKSLVEFRIMRGLS